MFQGSIPAIITPFRDGAVDEAALVDLVNWHVVPGEISLETRLENLLRGS